MLTGDELNLNNESYRIYLPNHTYFNLGQLLERYKYHSEYNNIFVFENMPTISQYPFDINSSHNIRIFEEVTPVCCCSVEIEEFTWGPIHNHRVSWYNHNIIANDYLMHSPEYY
jgi:hypothetical protein